MIKKNKKHPLGTVVYGVFGDTPRSDKDNIESVWFHEDLAKERLEWLKENDNYNSYHLEILEMEDSLEKLPPHKDSPSEIWGKVCNKMMELDFPKIELKLNYERNKYIWSGDFRTNETYLYIEISPISESTHYGQIFCNLDKYCKNIFYQDYNEFEKGLEDMRKYLNDNEINLYELEATEKAEQSERGR